MPLENATRISELDPANPLGSDSIGDGDNHIRMIKQVLKNEEVHTIKQYTLAEAKALTGAVIGQIIQITDRDNAQFEYVAPTANNEFDLVDAPGSGLTLSLITNGEYNVVHFGADPGDVLHDDFGAISAAIGLNRTITLPPGNGYYVSQPLAFPDYCTFKGGGVVSRDSADEVSIYAPNGFFLNAGNDRVWPTFENIKVYGDGKEVAGKVGFNGRFGGVWRGVTVQDYETLVNNDFAFLLEFNDCRFDGAVTGAQIATANGTIFNKCWFGSSVERGIDTLDTVLGSGAVGTCFPLTVRDCNFNGGTVTEFMIRARGGVNIEDNYIEAFAATAGQSLVQIIAGRFDDGFLRIVGNEINGQNQVNHLIKVYGNNASGTISYSGEITKNRLIGSLSNGIVIGSNELGASTEVQGIEIYGNSGGGATVDYSQNPANMFRPFFRGEDTGPVDVSGSSYVPIPIVDSADSYGDPQASGTTWNVPKSGVWRVSYSLTYVSTTTVRNLESRISVNGATYKSMLSSVTAPTAESHYTTVSFSADLELSKGDDVQFSARNGGTAHQIIVNAKFVEIVNY